MITDIVQLWTYREGTLEEFDRAAPYKSECFWENVHVQDVPPKPVRLSLQPPQGVAKYKYIPPPCIEQLSEPGEAKSDAEILSRSVSARLVGFDGFREDGKHVSPTCLISFERNRYSVPTSFASRPVSLRV